MNGYKVAIEDGCNCSCDAGFTGQDCSVDINECESSPCANSGVCIDDIDRFECICSPGFTGETCETDLNECISDPCDNGSTCIDGPDSYNCACADGFTGFHCDVDIFECASMPCAWGSACLDEVNGYSCLCDPGFNGTHCENDICSSIVCSNHGTPIGIVNGCICECIPGFDGDYCQTDVGPSYDAANPLVVDNGYYSGEWGYIDVCPTGYYVSGARLSADDSIVADDWGADAVKLYCKHVVTYDVDYTITSTALEWGAWHDESHCGEEYFVTRFRMYSEPSQGDGDDTATNQLKIECTGPGLNGSDRYMLNVDGTDRDLAEWGSTSDRCPEGQAVNALQVKYEEDQGFWEDDAAIGDVKMFCSDY